MDPGMGLERTWSALAFASCAVEAGRSVFRNDGRDGRSGAFHGKAWEKTWEYGEIREDDGKPWDVGVKNFDDRCPK